MRAVGRAARAMRAPSRADEAVGSLRAGCGAGQLGWTGMAPPSGRGDRRDYAGQ